MVRRRNSGGEVAFGLGCILQFVFFVVCVGGWFQHLYTCFNQHLYGFLIAGAIFFPIAIIHGWGIWFGWWH